MRWGPLVLFAVGVLRAVPAFAAHVTVVPDEKSSKGAVMLSRGQGYAPITGQTTANTGDSVIAFTGGHAKIIYPDGCTVDVNDGGTIFVVSETSPCKAPLALLTNGSLPAGKYVVGAAIIGGGVAAVLLTTGGGGDNGGGGKKESGRHHDHGSGHAASP